MDILIEIPTGLVLFRLIIVYFAPITIALFFIFIRKKKRKKQVLLEVNGSKVSIVIPSSEARLLSQKGSYIAHIKPTFTLKKVIINTKNNTIDNYGTSGQFELKIGEKIVLVHDDESFDVKLISIIRLRKRS